MTNRLSSSSSSFSKGFEDFESNNDEDDEVKANSLGQVLLPQHLLQMLKSPDMPSFASKSTSEEVIIMYAYIGDLKKGFKTNENIALWRRDGPTLLQKFIRNKSESDQTRFTSTMSFSNWEDHRKNEFIQIFVKPVSESLTELCVEVMDCDAAEQTCVFEKFHELDLDPYVSYADRNKKKEMTKTDTEDDEEEMETS